MEKNVNGLDSVFISITFFFKKMTVEKNYYTKYIWYFFKNNFYLVVIYICLIICFVTFQYVFELFSKRFQNIAIYYILTDSFYKLLTHFFCF